MDVVLYEDNFGVPASLPYRSKTVHVSLNDTLLFLSVNVTSDDFGVSFFTKKFFLNAHHFKFHIVKLYFWVCCGIPALPILVFLLPLIPPMKLLCGKHLAAPREIFLQFLQSGLL